MTAINSERDGNQTRDFIGMNVSLQTARKKAVTSYTPMKTANAQNVSTSNKRCPSTNDKKRDATQVASLLKILARIDKNKTI